MYTGKQLGLKNANDTDNMVTLFFCGLVTFMVWLKSRVPKFQKVNVLGVKFCGIYKVGNYPIFGSKTAVL